MSQGYIEGYGMSKFFGMTGFFEVNTNVNYII